MKKKFIYIAKRFNCEISEFISYRSDMGCQIFEMIIQFPDGSKTFHDDSYFVGSNEEKEKVLNYFEQFCSEKISNKIQDTPTPGTKTGR